MWFEGVLTQIHDENTFEVSANPGCPGAVVLFGIVAIEQMPEFAAICT